MAIAELLHELVIRRRGERQDELTCVRLPDGLGEVGEAAQQREPTSAVVAVGHGIRIDVPDRTQPVASVIQ